METAERSTEIMLEVHIGVVLHKNSLISFQSSSIIAESHIHFEVLFGDEITVLGTICASRIKIQCTQKDA